MHLVCQVYPTKYFLGVLFLHTQMEAERKEHFLVAEAINEANIISDNMDTGVGGCLLYTSPSPRD